MRRTIPVTTALYRQLFPNPTVADPPNFNTHLQRNLIPEIRIETNQFYGSLDSVEARYPGLNYTHAPHRLRLSRFPHHNRLFKAMDELGLTDGEILDLVRWEGTLWARERYERDEGVKVRDTTGDGIGQWRDPRKLKVRVDVAVEEVLEDREEVLAESRLRQAEPETSTHIVDGPLLEVEDEEMDEDEEEEDLGEAIEEFAQRTNRRLFAAIMARESGRHVEMDPEMEQYLKEQLEAGNIADLLRAWSNSSTRLRELARRRIAASVPATTVTQPQPTL